MRKLSSSVLLGVLLALLCVTAVSADGPVYIELGDTLTCPGCSRTGQGWITIPRSYTPADQAIMDRIGARVAAEKGYPSGEYATTVVVDEAGCGSSTCAGAVLQASGQLYGAFLPPGTVERGVDAIGVYSAQMQCEECRTGRFNPDPAYCASIGCPVP